MTPPASVRLRAFERTHLAATLRWMNDPALMRLLDRARPITAAEHEAWFQSLASREDCAYFAIERTADDAHIGNVWLWAIDRRHRRAEVRIVIGDARGTGRGCGTEALRLIALDAFGRLALHKIYALVLAINPRARRAFEKAGFIEAGRLRDDRWLGDGYTDVHLLERLSTDVPGP